MAKTVIFLDVDGVLNALALNVRKWADMVQEVVFDDFEEHDIKLGMQTFSCSLSQKMADELKALDADIIWLTTWRHYATEDLTEILGFPAYPYLEWNRSKLLAIQEFLNENEEHQKVVWLDDDFVSDLTIEVLQEDYPDLKILGIAPSSKVGLIPAEVEQVRQFIDTL